MPKQKAYFRPQMAVKISKFHFLFSVTHNLLERIYLPYVWMSINIKYKKRNIENNKYIMKVDIRIRDRYKLKHLSWGLMV